jgi:hypothetical protein
MTRPPLTTVRDLIDALSTLDPSLPVILASDEEGNDFHPFSGDVTEQTYNIDWRETDLTPEQYVQYLADPKSVYTEDDAPPEIDGEHVVRAVVLWP